MSPSPSNALLICRSDLCDQEIPSVLTLILGHFRVSPRLSNAQGTAAECHVSHLYFHRFQRRSRSRSNAKAAGKTASLWADQVLPPFPAESSGCDPPRRQEEALDQDLWFSTPRGFPHALRLSIAHVVSTRLESSGRVQETSLWNGLTGGPSRWQSLPRLPGRA